MTDVGHLLDLPYGIFRLIAIFPIRCPTSTTRVKRQITLTGMPRLLFLSVQLVSVIHIQAVCGTEPQESFMVFQYRVYGILRQSVVDGEVFKKERLVLGDGRQRNEKCNEGTTVECSPKNCKVQRVCPGMFVCGVSLSILSCWRTHSSKAPS